MNKTFTFTVGLICVVLLLSNNSGFCQQASIIGIWDGEVKNQQKKGWEVTGKLKIAVSSGQNENEFIIRLVFYEMSNPLKNKDTTCIGVLDQEQSNGSQKKITFAYLGENFKNPEKKINGTIRLAVETSQEGQLLKGVFSPDKISLSYQPEVWILKSGTGTDNSLANSVDNSNKRKSSDGVNVSNGNKKSTIINIETTPKIAPDVKRLEVDKMDKFFGGFAVVQKGTAFGLINDKGDFVIPFNKYTFNFTEYFGARSFHQSEEFGRGKFYPSYYGSMGQLQNTVDPIKLIGFTDTKTGKNGYIDTKGRIHENVKNLRNGDFSGYDPEGYFVESASGSAFSKGDGKLVLTKYDGSNIVGKGNYISQGTSGQLVNYSPAFTYSTEGVSGYSGWSNGLMPAVDVTNKSINISQREKENKRIGYINRKGEFQIKPDFFAVGEFSEGVAFVAKKDEFDELRWGAIDTLGNLIIPFKYRRQPGRFSHGRALIKAVGMDNIEYAFINKKDKIIFTIPKNSGDTISVGSLGSYGSEKFLFSEGYHPVRLNLKSGKGKDNVYLLDTAGNYIPIMSLLRKHLPEGTIEIKSSIKEGQFLFYHFLNQKGGFGIADVRGNVIIEPNFHKLELFEKESTLQHAIWGRGNNTSDIGIEGYINRNAVFQIIKEKRAAGF